MAKLTGVKTVDMVNGEITKVSYNGAEYTKVDGIDHGRKVHDGDIGLINSVTITFDGGEYYEMISRTEDTTFLRFKSDNRGDRNGLKPTAVTVFRNLYAMQRKHIARGCGLRRQGRTLFLQRRLLPRLGGRSFRSCGGVLREDERKLTERVSEMAFQVGDIIHFTADFPRLEVVTEASPMGSGKIALKTAQYWADKWEDVYLVERAKE